MNSFISELEDELRPKIDRVLQSRYLARLSSGTLSFEELREFAIQYWYYCQYFPRLLAAAAANVPDDQTRDSLVKNLWEEHGKGDPSRSHRVLFLKFALALNVESELDQRHPFASTDAFVHGMFKLCQSSHFLEAVGALSVGGEFYTSEQFRLILSGLERYSFLSASSLEFWRVHISVDVGHYEEMAISLSRWTETEEWRSLIRRGAHQAIALDLVFWEGLENEAFGSTGKP
ncbi:MAG TPA: iron-containing redox enzyme family protein [Pyrinomonadaceae bacterium]|nr:iron-containing redox enzyme family protein [Pyrinomonadaceae bacterium]